MPYVRCEKVSGNCRQKIKKLGCASCAVNAAKGKAKVFRVFISRAMSFDKNRRQTSTNLLLFVSLKLNMAVFYVVHDEISLIRHCGACKRRHSRPRRRPLLYKTHFSLVTRAVHYPAHESWNVYGMQFTTIVCNWHWTLALICLYPTGVD